MHAFQVLGEASPFGASSAALAITRAWKDSSYVGGLIWAALGNEACTVATTAREVAEAEFAANAPAKDTGNLPSDPGAVREAS